MLVKNELATDVVEYSFDGGENKLVTFICEWISEPYLVRGRKSRFDSVFRWPPVRNPKCFRPN